MISIDTQGPLLPTSHNLKGVPFCNTYWLQTITDRTTSQNGVILPWENQIIRYLSRRDKEQGGLIVDTCLQKRNQRGDQPGRCWKKPAWNPTPGDEYTYYYSIWVMYENWGLPQGGLNKKQKNRIIPAPIIALSHKLTTWRVFVILPFDIWSVVLELKSLRFLFDSFHFLIPWSLVFTDRTITLGKFCHRGTTHFTYKILNRTFLYFFGKNSKKYPRSWLHLLD